MSRWIGIPAQPAGLGPTGRKLCRGRCGGEVGPGRSSWCGDEGCIEDAMIRAGSSSWVRDAVFYRDRGVCALCGANADLAQRVDDRLRQKEGGNTWTSVNGYVIAHGSAVLRAAWDVSPWAIHWWEADHIVPVAEGGGGCGLEGYRTLCRSCHHWETGLLRRRLNARRRAERKEA